MRVETAPYLLFPVFCRGAGRFSGRSVDRSTLTRAGAVEVVEFLWKNVEKLDAAASFAGTKHPIQTIQALWDEFEKYHRVRFGQMFDFDATSNVVNQVVYGSPGQLGLAPQGALVDWVKLASNQKYADTVLLPAACAGVGKRAGYAQWDYGWLYWAGTGLVDLLWWQRTHLYPPGPPSWLDFSKLDARDRVLSWTRWLLERLFPKAVGIRWSEVVAYLDGLVKALPLAKPAQAPRRRAGGFG